MNVVIHSLNILFLHTFFTVFSNQLCWICNCTEPTVLIQKAHAVFMSIIIVYTPASTFAFFPPQFPLTSSHCKGCSGNLVLILECKRLKMKRKRTEGETQRATAYHHSDSNHFHVCVCVSFTKSHNPPFSPYCAPLLLPLAKLTIKAMHVTGRDIACCSSTPGSQPQFCFLGSAALCLIWLAAADAQMFLL